MLFDWFTTTAQALNFLVLALILKKLLYGPLVRAMDSREARIRAAESQAEQERSQAAAHRAALEAEREQLEQTRKARLEEATKAAADHRAELTEQARGEVKQLRRSWQQAVLDEQAAFLQELRSVAAQETMQVARRACQDLLHVSLNDVLVETFLRRVSSSAPQDLHGTPSDFAVGSVRIRTPVELDPEHRERVLAALGVVPDGAAGESDGRAVDVQFAVDEAMPLGIEAQADGRRLAWGIEPYLADLSLQVAAALSSESFSGEAPAADGVTHHGLE